VNCSRWSGRRPGRYPQKVQAAYEPPLPLLRERIPRFGHAFDRPFNVSATTITQRSSIRPKNTMAVQVSAFSTERMKNGRFQYALAKHHGISSRQKPASKVPTALARNEFPTSPRINRAKLVVMPHDGQGIPVTK